MYHPPHYTRGWNSILFLTVSIENILGPPHTNECHKQDHPKVPRATTVFKKSQDRLKKSNLKTNQIPTMGMCNLSLPNSSNTGLGVILPWLPSRNGNENAHAANILGEDTRQNKLVFNLITTVSKLKYTFKILTKQFLIFFLPLLIREWNK